MSEGHRNIRSYVLRGGRVTRLQQRALERLSDRYVLSHEDGLIDLHSLFDGRPVITEIGFGAGIATAQIAESRGEYGYVGIEVFRAGVGKLLSEIERRGLENVRIVQHDAVRVLEELIPPSSLAGVHLFFPDPWPKKRHHKRRIVQPTFAELLSSRLVIGGYLYAVTDWEDYAQWMLKILTAAPGLENSEDGYCDRKEWRPKTRFEQKAHEQGRKIFELFFTRIV